MKYPRYPKYKDSGVEWLGQVPEGWEVRRLKFSVENINMKCTEDEIDVPFVALEHIESWTGKLYLDEDSKSDGQPNEYKVNDVLFCKLRPYLAKVHLAKTHGVCTSELLILRSNQGTVPEYLYRFLLSRDVIDRITASTYGAKMPRASWEHIGNLPLLVPLKKEQQAIASFLDKECARIDALIAKKRRLLELLEEKRRAVITQAVTRGLDSSAPMKDSGVEWLGQVPKGWEVKRLKFCVANGFQYGANIAAELDDITLPRYIRITDMNDDGTLKEDTFRSLTTEDAAPYLLRDNDLLLARSGATVGKSFIYRASMGAAAYAGYLIRISPAKGVAPDFLYAFLNSDSYWQWVSSIFIQATIQNVSAEKYANLWVAIPPFPEQQAIASYLDAATTAIDAQRQAHEKSITLLQEYRASLITHAVTGKIDVRDYAPRQ